MKFNIFLLLLSILLIIPITQAKIQTSVKVVTPPTIKKVEISPENPNTTQDIVCNVSFIDFFKSETEYEWLKNGNPTSIKTNIINKDKLKDGDNWTCIVRVKNQHGQVEASKTVTIRELKRNGITGRFISTLELKNSSFTINNFFKWINSLF